MQLNSIIIIKIMIVNFAMSDTIPSMIIMTKSMINRITWNDYYLLIRQEKQYSQAPNFFWISVTYDTLNATKHPSPFFGMQCRLVLLMYDSCVGTRIMYDNVNFFYKIWSKFVQNLYKNTFHPTCINNCYTNGTSQINYTVSKLHTFS